MKRYRVSWMEQHAVEVEAWDETQAREIAEGIDPEVSIRLADGWEVEDLDPEEPQEPDDMYEAKRVMEDRL